jgi:hypothetical protein
VVLDGELVCWNEGRVDFAALQRRLHPSQARAQELAGSMPAAYVVFDLLALAGTDVRSKPYAARRPSRPAGSGSCPAGRSTIGRSCRSGLWSSTSTRRSSITGGATEHGSSGSAQSCGRWTCAPADRLRGRSPGRRAIESAAAGRPIRQQHS